MKKIALQTIVGGAVLPVLLCLAQGRVHAQVVPVPTAVVQQKALSQGYVLDGVIQAVQQSTVAAQTTGRIASFGARAGDKVRA